MWIKQIASPRFFYRHTRAAVRYLAIIGVLFISLGLGAGLLVAPLDAVQGEGFRMLYIHVPMAFGSLSLYAVVSICSVLFLIWRLKISLIIADAAAWVGLVYTILALITGSIWGKPMWGTFWVWDARLTSELILGFIIVAYLSLRHALPNTQAAAVGAAYVALIGALDLPIIHYSVEWWHSLHQGSTLLRAAKPAIDSSMAWPLYCSLLGFAALAWAFILMHSRIFILQRHATSRWFIEREPI